MRIDTEIEMSISPQEKYMLWGIMHHHINEPQLDEKEVEFRYNLLQLLDPSKSWEIAYETKNS